MGRFNFKPVIASLLVTALITSTILQGEVNADAASQKVKKVTIGVKVTKTGKLISTKTGKSFKGVVSYKGIIYKEGKKATGVVNGLYYKNGVKATGTYKEILYVKGKKASGVYSSIYYQNGKKATGFYKNLYYVNGKLANGEIKGAYYEDGKVVTDTKLQSSLNTSKIEFSSAEAALKQAQQQQADLDAIEKKLGATVTTSSIRKLDAEDVAAFIEKYKDQATFTDEEKAAIQSVLPGHKATVAATIQATAQKVLDAAESLAKDSVKVAQISKDKTTVSAAQTAVTEIKAAVEAIKNIPNLSVSTSKLDLAISNAETAIKQNPTKPDEQKTTSDTPSSGKESGTNNTTTNGSTSTNNNTTTNGTTNTNNNTTTNDSTNTNNNSTTDSSTDSSKNTSTTNGSTDNSNNSGTTTNNSTDNNNSSSTNEITNPTKDLPTTEVPTTEDSSTTVAQGETTGSSDTNAATSTSLKIDSTTSTSEVRITGTIDKAVTGLVVQVTSACYEDSSKTCTHSKFYTPTDGTIDQIIGLIEGAGNYDVSVYPTFNETKQYYLDDILYSGKVNNTDSVAPLQIGKTTTNSEVTLTGRIASNVKLLLADVIYENGTEQKSVIDVTDGIVDSKIYLRQGAGNYTVKIYYNTSTDKTSSFPYLMEGTAINSDTRTIYELPSQYVQSDNPEIVSLAKDITKSATSNMEKVKAVHDWVAKNIAYDTDDFFNNLNKKQDAYTTLSTKTAICQGYADLTAALLRAVNIPTKVVAGIGLGYGMPNSWDSVDKTKSNHAWNEAYVDGQWVILDTTWDSGFIDSNLKFYFSYRDQYFNPTAADFAKDHYKIEDRTNF